VRARLVVALAALVPFVALAWGSAQLADRGGQAIGAALARAFAAVPKRAKAASVEVPADLVALESTQPIELDAPRALTKTKSKTRTPRGGEGHEAPTRGLYVRAPVVMRIARSGVRPSGALVPARGERPAGIALHGVGGLGVGLQEGDILTQVAGQPARSPEAVIATVIGAYRAHAKAVSGRFWRGGELWSLVVEIPYPR